MKLINKVCTLFLCSALCLLSLPYTAQAAEPEDASKGLDFSQGFPIEETVYTAGEGTIIYTPPSTPDEPHKLTLNNASISTEEGSAAPAICFAAEQVFVDYSVEIEVVGKNTITVNDSGSDKNFGRRHAIYLRTTTENGKHFLKFSGNGTLNLNALVGIGIDSCDLEISNITVNTASSNRSSAGIYTSLDTSVRIEGAALNLNSSQGINASGGLLSIKNSNITIKIGRASCRERVSLGG